MIILAKCGLCAFLLREDCALFIVKVHNRRIFSPWKLPAVLLSRLYLKVSCISLELSPLGMCVLSWSVLWASLRQMRKTNE